MAMVFRRRRRAAAPSRPARDPQQQLAGEDGGSFDARAPEYRAAFARFLRQCYATELRQLRASLSVASTPGAHPLLLPSYDQQQQQQQQQQSFAYSLRICAQRLLDASPSLASLLFRHPDQLLPLFHAALADEVANSSADGLSPVAAAVSVPLRARQKLKVRVEHLPPVGGLRKPGISTVRSNDVKQLIQIAGTVVRTGMVRPCFHVVVSGRVNAVLTVANVDFVGENGADQDAGDVARVPVQQRALRLPVPGAVRPGAGQHPRDSGAFYRWRALAGERIPHLTQLMLPPPTEGVPVRVGRQAVPIDAV